MTSKRHFRSGGKYCSSHTTTTETAAIICDAAHKENEVTKINLGIITPKLGSVHSVRKVKFESIPCGLLLKVGDKNAVQQIIVHTPDIPKTRLNLARDALSQGISIAFKKDL